MPTALSRPRVRADMQLALCGRPAHNRDRRQHEIPIALAASQCPISRDFVPWRFLDAGPLSVRSVSLLPASKNLHNSRHSIWESGQLLLETEPTGDNFERFTRHVQVIHRGLLILIAARHSASDHFIGP